MRLASKGANRAMHSVLAALAAAFLVLSAGTVRAQTTPPGADHYLVYVVLNPPTISVPVILSDQFLPNVTYTTSTLEFFMTPVSKNGEVIIDPVTHYTWWHINPPVQPGALALITNQFGTDVQFQFLKSSYLLNPALKGITAPPTGPVPAKNHYLAYDAAAPFVLLNVTLQDQFFQYAAEVDQGRFLAAPAQKVFQGVVFPILDPVPHLAVYIIGFPPPVPPAPGSVFALDEFGTWQLQLGPPYFLAVPSFKDGVVPTHGTSWGRLKSIYR